MRVTSPDGGPSQPAAGPIDTVTGDDGRAVVRLAAPLAGWRTVVAEVDQVPLHWLRVRRADRKRQASAAEGGVRRTIVASARVAVRGPQSLTLAADPSVARGRLRRPGSWPRSTVTAHTARPRRRCTDRSRRQPPPLRRARRSRRSPMPVPGDGAYTLPAVAAVGAGGYYLWRVDVDGTDTSVPVASCGAPVRVRARPTVAAHGPGQRAGVRRQLVQVPVASGLPFGDRST